MTTSVRPPHVEPLRFEQGRGKAVTFLDDCTASSSSVLKCYVHHPWIEAMAEDTLTVAQFAAFQVNDGAHVVDYNRALAPGVTKAPVGHPWTRAALRILDGQSTSAELAEKKSLRRTRCARNGDRRSVGMLTRAGGLRQPPGPYRIRSNPGRHRRQPLPVFAVHQGDRRPRPAQRDSGPPATGGGPTSTRGPLAAKCAINTPRWPRR